MADRRPGAVNLRKTNRGVLLGEFEIGSEIGKGSFAQVYLGTQQATGAAVAIKSVELSRLNKKLKENLYSEIRILKKLRHPHIVALHDCLESSTHINLVMEYCELGDLSLFIKKREKHFTNPAVSDLARKYPPIPHAGLNEVVIRHFLQQLASALKFLRESNFVHRDVKPQNLLLLPSPGYRESHRQGPPILSASHDSLIPAAGLRSLPMLKLADFGFARVLPSTALAETLCGSPLYMAPEILRYEKYDAKADLWSVGTVLYEMVSGRPPFRASNHVELLRKIENTDDQIKFPREVQVTSELKSLIRALLKRNPVERLSFENFFSHSVVTSSIPGLVEDDVPKFERPPSSTRQISRTDEPPQASLSGRRMSMRRYQTDNDISRDEAGPSSPREKPLRSSPLASPGDFRPAQSPREDLAPGLGIRRPVPQPSTSAPNRPSLYDAARRRGLSNASATNYIREESSLVSSSLGNDAARRARNKGDRPTLDEQEKTAQDLAFEREYVVVEKKHVEVNALADELAAKGMQQALSPKSGQMVRRATQQGVPTSTTGAVPAYPSNALQVAQGKQRPDHNRRPSYDKMLSGSPNSTTSVISKAIQDASLRLFGVKYPTHLLGKGSSPPHMYNPFPAYPTPAPTAGMITDGRSSGPMDEDQRVANCIEDYATRSDVVWGFAEVKYKQLVPMTPSMDHGLGGAPADSEDDDGLTVEAVVVLSEEALVLYVKALSLLAKSMDIASIWWARRARGESTGSSAVASRDPLQSQNLINRVNSAVQWVRKRFNETLEKADVVRLRLVAAQEKLPEDHPSHPSRNRLDQVSLGTSGADGIVLTAGLSAEKLMYERAVEMSRTAAINEIANEDLAECQISYVTAIRLLEAVLDNDDDLPKRRSSTTKVEKETSGDEPSEINSDDQLAVKKMISMIKTRLNSLRKKIDMIEAASKAQQKHEQIISRKRSGDVTPRSVPAHLS